MRAVQRLVGNLVPLGASGSLPSESSDILSFGVPHLNTCTSSQSLDVTPDVVDLGVPTSDTQVGPIEFFIGHMFSRTEQPRELSYPLYQFLTGEIERTLEAHISNKCCSIVRPAPNLARAQSGQKNSLNRVIELIGNVLLQTFWSVDVVISICSEFVRILDYHCNEPCLRQKRMWIYRFGRSYIDCDKAPDRVHDQLVIFGDPEVKFILYGQAAAEWEFNRAECRIPVAGSGICAGQRFGFRHYVSPLRVAPFRCLFLGILGVLVSLNFVRWVIDPLVLILELEIRASDIGPLSLEPPEVFRLWICFLA